LALGRCRLALRVQRVMMKDSLDMTPADRQRILRSCLLARESKLVITHGTDTMEQTARFLAPHITNKTVVLTGAMIPFRFGSSDGLFNLGGAIAFAQTLPVGVYVAMNGRYFFWDQVTKNRERGCFVETKDRSRIGRRSGASAGSGAKKKPQVFRSQDSESRISH